MNKADYIRRWHEYARANNGNHPDWCECEKCIKDLMENGSTRGNHKGSAFWKVVNEYDGLVK